VSVRPEHLVFVPPADGTINATVEFALPLGPTVVHELALDNGDRVKVTVARTGAHAWLAPGTRTGLAVAPGAPVAVFQA
jgi:putative spermidine/putrescine transport system ATP-binding protein